MDLRPEIQSIRMQISMPERVEVAFSRLEQILLQHYPELLTSFATHQAAYHKNEFENIEGTIHTQVYRVEYRKVIRAFNHLLDRILAEERRLSGAGIRKGSDLSIVSCDRKDIIKRFSISFDTREEAGVHTIFYLLTGRKFGQADSLVKRLITTLKEDREGVKYPGFDQIVIRDVDLSPGDSLQDARFFFRKAFNRNLRPQVKSLAEFAVNIEQSYPAYRQSVYLPFAFRVNFSENDLNTVEALIQWLVTDFCRADQTARRKFIFFFILNRKGDARRRSIWPWFRRQGGKMSFREYQRKILSWQNPEEGIIVLPNLSRVKYEDLDDWYKHYEPNEALRTEKLRQLVRDLGGGSEWNMSQVELELAKIVRAYQERKHGI